MRGTGPGIRVDIFGRIFALSWIWDFCGKLRNVSCFLLLGNYFIVFRSIDGFLCRRVTLQICRSLRNLEDLWFQIIDPFNNKINLTFLPILKCNRSLYLCYTRVRSDSREKFFMNLWISVCVVRNIYNISAYCAKHFVTFLIKFRKIFVQLYARYIRKNFARRTFNYSRDSSYILCDN